MIYNTVAAVLKTMGYKTVDSSFYLKQQEWEDWYSGNVEKFHKYIVDTGTQKMQVHRYTAAMAKQVCEDWADLLMNEKVDIAIEGDAENEFVHAVLDDNCFNVRGNEMQEEKGRTGTVAYVPHIVGAVVDGNGYPTGEAEGIVIDYIPGDQIFPLSWVNGKIREVAFAQTVDYLNRKYLYLQVHIINKATKLYDIQNYLYDITSAATGIEVPLDTVPEYANLPAVVHTLFVRPQFVIDRFNIKNNIASGGPMGVSVYANAIDQLKSVDIAYDSYVNDFVLGKKRIIVKVQTLKDLDGNPVFDTSDLVYYALPEDGEQDTLIKEVDMSIRAEQHSRGIQDMLNVLGQKCGLGNNFYKFDGGATAKTAKEVISSNSKLFRTLKKHEIVLDSVLKDLCRIILHLGNFWMGQELDEETDIKIHFDDSIIEDTQAEFERDRALVGMGAMAAWELRARYLGESAEEAKKNVPKMEELSEEPPEE